MQQQTLRGSRAMLFNEIEDSAAKIVIRDVSIRLVQQAFKKRVIAWLRVTSQKFDCVPSPFLRGKEFKRERSHAPLDFIISLGREVRGEFKHLPQIGILGRLVQF